MQPNMKTLEEFIASIRAAEFVRDMRDLCERVWIDNYLNKFYRRNTAQDACLETPTKGENNMFLLKGTREEQIRLNPCWVIRQKIIEVKNQFANLGIVPTNEELIENVFTGLEPEIPKKGDYLSFYKRTIPQMVSGSSHDQLH